MTEFLRIRFWIAAMVLSLAVAGAQAQEQTPASPGATDTNTTSQVFQDASSEACDAKNNTSPNVDGYNPAFCMKVTTTTGGCGPIGGADTTLVGQAGNTCYYCQQEMLPAGAHLIVVPAGSASNAASQQGYVCGVALSDPVCYLGCYGMGSFVPPAGVTRMGPGNGTADATSSQPQQQPMKLQGYVSNTPDPCYPAGPKQYNACDYPNVTKPAGCVCSSAQPAQKAPPAVQPSTNAPAAPALQAASDFSNELRADAEKLLQSAGQISKAMTDANNPATHNNVGINVGLFAFLGAAPKMLPLLAQEYQALAAAGNAVAAADQAPIVAIANEAAAESGTMASQAEEAVAELGKTAAATGSAGAPMGSSIAVGTTGLAVLPYQEGMVYMGAAASQGDLPICAALSCANLAGLLGKNVPTLRLLATGLKITPVPPGATASNLIGGGLTAEQMVTALQRVGVNAEVLNSVTAQAAQTSLLKLLSQGKPLIAGVKIFGNSNPALDSELHAVTIQGWQQVGKDWGLRIYDPAGWYYWQPLKSFLNSFNGVMVIPK